LKIVVCVKQTPDSAADLTVEGGKVSWGDAALILNPWDEYAVEAALQQRELLGGTVTALSLGDENAEIALRYALAMGADEALRIADPGPVSDTSAVAHVLAATIQKLGGVDLAFFGRQAIDGDSGLVPAQTARLLGWPSLTLVSALTMDGNNIRVERSIEEGRQTVSAKLPAVVSLNRDFGQPRFPSFLNKRKADRAVIPVWSLAEAGVAEVALRVSWTDPQLSPVRETACEFIAGNSLEVIAEKLAERILAGRAL
jgi:electron transfer flavoprotein beta subunit